LVDATKIIGVGRGVGVGVGVVVGVAVAVGINVGVGVTVGVGVAVGPKMDAGKLRLEQALVEKSTANSTITRNTWFNLGLICLVV
jgi:hypothetical protein